VTGETDSTNFPTKNAFQKACGGSSYDAFVTKFAPSGSSLSYSTYLGGSDYEIGYGIAVDSIGRAFVTGDTKSIDFPTKNAFQKAHGGGSYDAFVTKLTSSGSSLSYSTYLGGDGVDKGHGIAVNSSGSAYVTGATDSSDFPTKNAFQKSGGVALMMHLPRNLLLQDFPSSILPISEQCMTIKALESLLTAVAMPI